MVVAASRTKAVGATITSSAPYLLVSSSFHEPNDKAHEEIAGGLNIFFMCTERDKHRTAARDCSRVASSWIGMISILLSYPTHPPTTNHPTTLSCCSWIHVQSLSPCLPFAAGRARRYRVHCSVL